MIKQWLEKGLLARSPRSAQRGPRRVRLDPRSPWQRLLLLAGVTLVLALLGALLGRGAGAGQVTGVALAPPPTPARPAATRPPATPAPAGPATAPTPNLPPAADPAERWPVLLSEPFERPSAEWPELLGSSWWSRYRDGGYELALVARPSISYSAPLPARDFWLSADLRLGSGQAGLFCLLRRPNDFYRFLIDIDGRYRLEVQQVGAAQPLIDWTASDALRTGSGALNLLAARRSGDTLTLYANGQPLASYALPSGDELEGRVGVALDAPTGARAGSAWFDNLEVRAP